MKWRHWLVPGLVLLLAGCVTVNTPLSSGSDQTLKATTISGRGKAEVLWVPIDGFISASPSSSAFGLIHHESTLTRVERTLDKAAGDRQIKAVVLSINSPGGTVSASDAIYHRIKMYEQNTGVPVIAYLGGIAASGGYYVAMSANRVIASPTTITGSIGVIIVDINASGLMNKLGLTDTSVVSGPHKDILSPLRPPRPGDHAIVQRVVNGLYRRFVHVVVSNRPDLDKTKLDMITDGRIFDAADAKQLGLVDAIGYRDDAIAAAKSAAGVTSARVVRYYQGTSPPRTLSAAASVAAVQGRASVGNGLAGLLEANGIASDGPAALYLWRDTTR